MAFKINPNECVGCGACFFACPFDVPKLSDTANVFSIDAAKCISCGQCEDICPVMAISPDQNHKAIRKVEIAEEKCVGCTLCAKNCPADAIEGSVKNPHVVDQRKCIKCGYCATKCKKDAIIISRLH